MNPPIRIAAACVSKDAADILPVLVAHYIRHGIRDFYLVMHCDQPDVSKQLVATMGKLANFTIYHHNGQDFHQAAMTNMLLQLARADGCEVFLPFDSDEFYEPTDGARILADVISEWVAGGNGEQMHVPMFNYFAPNDTEVFSPQTLGQISHRVRVRPGVSKEDLNSRFWWLRKSISRIDDAPQAEKINVTIGNHQTLRSREPLKLFTPLVPSEPDVPESYPIVIRHIPWRSREFTTRPALLSRALFTAVRNGEDFSTDEHARLFEETWDAYSTTPGADVNKTYDYEQFSLIPDDACVRILTRLEEAGFDISDTWCRPTSVSPSALSRGSTASTTGEFVSRVFVDDPAFDAGVMATRAQDSRANRERDRVIEMRERKDERISRLQERVNKLTEQKAALQERLGQVRNQAEPEPPEQQSGALKPTASPCVAIRVVKRVLRSIDGSSESKHG